jgi:hypothetical protein
MWKSRSPEEKFTVAVCAVALLIVSVKILWEWPQLTSTIA